MLKWKHVVSLDKVKICQMLDCPEKKEGSHLFKMNAIQIIALACSFDVPFLTDEEEKSH